jgi:hypothetical protein
VVARRYVAVHGDSRLGEVALQVVERQVGGGGLLALDLEEPRKRFGTEKINNVFFQCQFAAGTQDSSPRLIRLVDARYPARKWFKRQNERK